MTEVQTLLKLIGEKSRVQIVSGFYRGLDGLRATVDFSDGRVPAYFASGVRPELNESVWVVVTDGAAYMLGPTVPKPAEGTMVIASDGIADVLTDIGTVKAVYRLGDTFAPGDPLMLDWNGGCRIIGIKSANPTGPEIPPAPGGGGGRTTKTFTANDSGSYQSGYGWRTQDVWSSANNIGAWFYGNKIRDTIPDSASIIRAEIYLPQTKNVGAAPFGRHSSATKPVGPVAFSATAELPARRGWVRIPNSLIDHLKTNTGGLGFDLGGYNIWSGTQQDGQSGALRVTYQT